MSTDRQTFGEAVIQMAHRPTMYIGEYRFDYWIQFLMGYRAHAYKVAPWKYDYDMQRWLFLKESVSIRSSYFNGWVLFQCCYGNGKEALDQFKAMVEEVEFSYDERYDTVYWHINQICHFYEFGPDLEAIEYYNKMGSDYYPASNTIKDIIGEIKHDYKSLIPLITRMIDEPFDDLRIYLHYERYFLCVKFLYYTKDKGWVDNTSLTDQPGYYHSLVILHAYASLIQKKEHPNHIISMRHKNKSTTINYKKRTDVWYEILNKGLDISACDKNPFSKSYANWSHAPLSRN